jgi:predicted AlkP superfamily pyrophosphatase or phosphodiesterase
VDNGVQQHFVPSLRDPSEVRACCALVCHRCVLRALWSSRRELAGDSLREEGGTDAQWDVLIGHGLGVDHAGHIFGVDSAAMRAKLAQTDQLIHEVSAPSAACIRATRVMEFTQSRMSLLTQVLSIIDAAGHPGGAHHDTVCTASLMTHLCAAAFQREGC